MKICLLISLLFLSILLHEAQGIRLGKATTSESHHHELQKKNDSAMKQRINTKGGAGVNEEAAVVCKEDGHCSKGMIRKLMTKTIPTSTPISSSKNYKNEGNKADPKLKRKINTSEGVGGEKGKISNKSSPVSDHQEVAASEQYPGTLDLVEMDYSLARRKSPIHN